MSRSASAPDAHRKVADLLQAVAAVECNFVVGGTAGVPAGLLRELVILTAPLVGRMWLEANPEGTAAFTALYATRLPPPLAELDQILASVLTSRLGAPSGAVSGEARARGRPLLRLTRFLTHPNELRRRSDRIEALIVALLLAVFLVGVAAAPYFGIRVYRWQRASAAHLHPAVAVLSQTGPTNSYMIGYGAAAARWRVADGRWRSGVLTTLTSPAPPSGPGSRSG